MTSAIAEYDIYSTNLNSSNPDYEAGNANGLFNGEISIYFFYNKGAYACAAVIKIHLKQKLFDNYLQFIGFWAIRVNIVCDTWFFCRQINL